MNTRKDGDPPNESTELMGGGGDTPPGRVAFPPIRRLFFTSSFTSMTFAFTQTSLIYAFADMTCEEYYRTHEWSGQGDRCALSSIQAQTASSIALMSSITIGSCELTMPLVEGGH